jgi:N-methylhydantoinase A
LNPGYFLGGEIQLGLKEAEQAIQNSLTETLGLDLVQAAYGIVKLADTNMAHAVGVMTVERGYDPRDFVMVAYGGAGPCHAVSVARELNIRRIVIPYLPGNFSAFGMLFADVKHEYVLSTVKLLERFDARELESAYVDLERQGIEAVQKEGFDLKDILLKRAVEMRYEGQEFTLVVPFADRPIDDRVKASVKNNFDAAYDVRYGHSFPASAGEVVSLRLEVYGLLPKPEMNSIVLEGNQKGGGSREKRDVYFEGCGFTPCAVFRRMNLTDGTKIDGPAIIEEPASTTVVHPGDILTVDKMGNLIIDLKGN